MIKAIEEYIQSPLKAIRANCLQCVGGSAYEVKTCTAKNCYLFPFRFGKNPYTKKREMTEEQRTAATERLQKARARRTDKRVESDEP